MPPSPSSGNFQTFQTPGMFSPKRQILISRRHHRDLFKIAEDQEKEIALRGDVMFRYYHINRIRQDSIYLNDTGYRFNQIDSLCLAEVKHLPFGRLVYNRDDTVKWEVIFPPDSAYFSRRSFSVFMDNLEKRKKRERFDWRTPTFRHNMIKWNFSRLALLQIVGAYEVRFTRKWSVEFEGGYQFKAGTQLSPHGPINSLPFYRFEGPVSQIGVKYCFNPRGYVQSLVHYNYLVMDSAVSKLPTGTLCLQFNKAQDAVIEGQKNSLKLANMHTTAVVLIVQHDLALWGHIGDTRLYYFHEGRLQKQTSDHSVPQLLANAGEIDASDIRFHEDRNRLLRSIGSEDSFKPHLEQSPIILHSGDAFLLCTDGFWEYVFEAEMAEDLQQTSSAEQWLKSMELRLLGRAPEGTHHPVLFRS